MSSEKKSNVKITKNNGTIRFDQVKVGSFFSYGQCIYLRYEVVEKPTTGQSPRNTVRIHDGASIRFEPHTEVQLHEEVEVILK